MLTHIYINSPRFYVGMKKISVSTMRTHGHDHKPITRFYINITDASLDRLEKIIESDTFTFDWISLSENSVFLCFGSFTPGRWVHGHERKTFENPPDEQPKED